MKAIVTTKSVVVSKPVFDGKGKPVMEKVKFNGREVEHHAHDHIQHPAGATLVVGDHVSEELAVELVEGGHARETVAGLDDEVSPVKADDVLS